MRTSRILDWCFMASVIFYIATGCDQRPTESNRRDAQLAYDQAAASMESKDYTTAKDRLTKALGAGLYSDLCDDAFGMRAVCEAALGDFQAAQADIDQMERGGAEQSLVLATKAFLFQKQGKHADSKNALQKAKRLNPKVRTYN